ncbi:MAG: helix-turn-helix domain-containing protein [Clostridia bacterium]
MQAFHEHRPYNPDFPISIARSYNLTFMPHWHRDVELVYVSRGSLKMGINQENYVLYGGDMAVAGSRDIHYFENLQKNTEVYLVIFHPEVIGHPAGWPAEKRFLSPFLVSSLVDKGAMDNQVLESLRQSIQRIYREQEEAKEGYSLFIKSRIYDICATLIRYFPSVSIDTRMEQSRLRNLKRIQAVLQYIDNHYTRRITLEEAASQENLSPFHFSRLFKSTLGMTFKKYVNRVRINHAEALLQNSDLSITDIAFECGFESIRTFNRVYRSIKGASPSETR